MRKRGNGTFPLIQKNTGIWSAPAALFGGNANNAAGKPGAFYVTLNNEPANANWNIGAAPSYLRLRSNADHVPRPLAEINSKQAPLVSICSKRERG